MARVDDPVQAELALLRASGLFLVDWVLARNAALAASGLDALEYFCRQGWRRGEWPNPYFDPGFYLAANQDVAQAGVNPLLHYAMHGDREGRDPCAFFDVKWYRAQYGVALRENALAHFLARRMSGQVAPVPIFDPAWYIEQNPDVAANGGDPFEHFLSFGAPELRDPAEGFDIKFYVARYGALLEGRNPLLHYLAHRASGEFVPARPEHEKLIPGAVRTATRPSMAFEEFCPVPPAAARRAKILAFYLPQFHRVAENDAWWGKGFTDWTNLARAVPRFAGHLQPRVPRDLGFYDLADPATLRRQIELAQGGGVHGFVFYYYWFNGKRLLETPLAILLADATLAMPFCVMWANENFTRRWDGLEREVLLQQDYREADDASLIAGFVRLFTDARYIRIEGRPLLMIYRAGLIPDARRRLALWREMFAAAGENPILVMAQSLGDHDPRPYGLDGAVEFPPHKICDEMPKVNDRLDLFDPEFAASVYDYGEVAAASVAMPAPDYPLIRTLAPGWDNEPRREGKGLVLRGASPALYQDWLEKLVAQAGKNPFFGERLVAVNAWNEWAEGAFLEPDIHFGAAFLNATARAVCGRAAPGKAALVLVGHDAQPHGAQLLLLNLARHYSQVCGFEVLVLLLGAGRLVTEYEKVARVTLTSDKAMIANFVKTAAARGARAALVNSAAAARMVPMLRDAGMRTTLLVHEMKMLLAEYNLQIQARRGALAADAVVFASSFGAETFCAALDIALPAAVILPQGNYQNVRYDAAARAAMRARLGVGAREFLVLGAGFGDLRKGFDLVVRIAGKMLKSMKHIRFVWVGDAQPVLKTYLAAEMAALGERFRVTGFSEEMAAYMSAADCFALTSREDPYPTVALEAIAAGLPVVAFDESGGIPALLRAHEAGAVAKPGDEDDFRRKLAALLAHERLAAERPRLMALAARVFDQEDYAGRLLAHAVPGWRAVSVCVLNYNQAGFLRERLAGLFAQHQPVAEILLLDDGSDDDSVELARDCAGAAGRRLRVIANPANTGQVFGQWRRAAREAKGDFIWLAEADDDARPECLARLVEAMADPAVAMAVTDSAVIDTQGRLLAPDYGEAWRAAGLAWPAGTLEGAAFARRYLAERNLLFNVSAVLWRRAALLAALERCADELPTWRLAGDWRIYLEVLTAPGAKITLVADPLNRHRRHARSVTNATRAEIHVAEIARMQAIAARWLGLDEAAKARQAAYLGGVRAELEGKKALLF